MRTALLILDVTNGFADRHGSPNMLSAIAKARTAARAVDIPVIYSRLGFRPGMPEMSERNIGHAHLVSLGTGLVDQDGAATQIHPAVAPREKDVVVVKRRVSAFSGSDLQVVLRAMHTDALVFTGIATSWAVLTTLSQAVDLDYKATVLRDGCGDADNRLHQICVTDIFPRMSEVVETDLWVEQIAQMAQA